MSRPAYALLAILLPALATCDMGVAPFGEADADDKTRFSFSGRVTQAGEPVAEVGVNLTNFGMTCWVFLSSGPCTWRASTSADGRYSLQDEVPKDACGSFTIGFSKVFSGLNADGLAVSGCASDNVDYDFPPYSLKGSITWPFEQIELDSVPQHFSVSLGQCSDGEACSSLTTVLGDVIFEPGSVLRHRIDQATDPMFYTFVSCLWDSTMDWLSASISPGEVWIVRETDAWAASRPSLSRNRLAWIDLVVEHLVVTQTASGALLNVQLRWEFFGT